MKYFLCLLMLTTIAYAQDTPVFAEPNGMTNKGSTVNFSGGLTVTGSLAYVSLDTAWLLSHGWKLVDTVKWKPYYQKKKHHPRKDNYIPTYIDLPNGLDTIFSNGDLIVKGSDVQIGGPLQSDTTINGYGMTGSTITGKAINFDSFYLSAHGLIPKEHPEKSLGQGLTLAGTPTITIDSVEGDKVFYKSGYKRDLWLPVPYPWWKKALWMVSGELIMILLYYVMKVRKII